MKPAQKTALALTLALGIAAPVVRAQHARHHGNGSASAAAPAGQAALLRLQFSPGQQLHYTSRATQSTTRQGQAISVVTTATLDMETLSVDAQGNAHMRFRLGGFEMTGPGIAPERVAQVRSAIAGMSVEYTLSPRGQVVAHGEPTGVAPEVLPLVSGVLQSLDEMFPQLPEQPVAPGGSWTEHRTPSVGAGGAAMNEDVTYTLRSLQGGVATIGIAMNMSMASTAAGQGRSVTSNGTATGEVTFDLSRGAMTHSASTANVTLEVRSGQQQMRLPMTMAYDMTLQ